MAPKTGPKVQAKAKTKAVESVAPKVQAMSPEAITSDQKQVFRVVEKTSEEEISRYASMPGVEIEFDVPRFKKLEDSFVAMLPASAQKNYWISFADFNDRVKMADRALYETPHAVDPISKLLDGPHGMANPLVKAQDEVQRILGSEYYVTWRVQGGEGDIDAALGAGFRVIRHPKDEIERESKSPVDWTGSVWKVRDGITDPTSGDEIFNVMVYIRAQAWKDHKDAMSMISHNAYSNNKKQFFEGADNLTRDMVSSKERIQVVDLDEFHVEEHTLIEGGKRVTVDPARR